MARGLHASASPDQREFAEAPIGPLVLFAPPGCGKTEALAYRAAALVDYRHVRAPQKILALTFSNRARDNLGERVQSHLGYLRCQRLVSIHNFHGFAARVVNSHQNLLGLDRPIIMPDRHWTNTQLDDMSVHRKARSRIGDIIRNAKQSFLADDRVASAIHASKSRGATELERRRIKEGRLDFDDLIRYSVDLLKIDGVRELYRAHFAAVLVDELQDMTLQQLEMVLLIGSGRTTLAGDVSQGIYSFAGARPSEVMARFDEEGPKIVVLTENYRSAPAILNLIAGIGDAVGGTPVRCGHPDEWQHDGEIRILRFGSTVEEASRVLDIVQRLLSADTTRSVGVVSRTHHRRHWIEDEAASRGMSFECWDRSVDSHHVRTILDRASIGIPKVGSSRKKMRVFRETCLDLVDKDDVELRDSVLDAIDTLNELAHRGIELLVAVQTLAVRSSDVVSPGLHLLSGHLGKGQQFDWVVVVGMEDDIFPYYLATNAEEIAEEWRVLNVMCSRARFGILFTVSRDVRWDMSREWIRVESTFLATIQEFVTGVGDPTI